MKTDHRTCIVTGSASGIGAATVMEMASHGYHTFGLDLNADGAQRVALQAGLEHPGTRHDGVLCDVADEAQVIAAFRQAHEFHGYYHRAVSPHP